MNCLRQCYTHSTVRYHGSSTLFAETHHLATDIECSARLLLNPGSFIIKEARWEVYRRAGQGRPEQADIAGLVGVEAFLNSGRALRAALGHLDDLALALFQETVKAAIQAETFLLQERGYKDYAHYDSSWKEFYLNSCRYYSHLDKVQSEWSQYISEQQRFKNLFTRNKSVHLYNDNEFSKVVAGFSDSFHELNIRLSIGRDCGAIKEASCQFLRVPDQVCRGSAEFIENLTGKSLQGLDKKTIAHLLGGPQGCVHAIDLSLDAINFARD